MELDILHLGERLVIAMETMSQDVKNISAHIYDLRCSVSYLVKEKKEKECIPVVANDVVENLSSVTTVVDQETSGRGEYSAQYELGDERSSSHIGGSELGESSFVDIASTSIDAHENSEVVSPESNSSFLNEVKSEAESLTDSTDETYGVYSTYCNPPEKVTPSRLLKTTELASTDVCRDIHHTEHSSNSAVNREYATHVDIIQEGQARTHQMKSSEDAFFMHTVEDSEERPHKCSLCEKSFKSLSKLKRHSRVHSGERPYKCHVCGKAYTQCSSLNTHMRSHTGEKPYKCNVCEKTFSQNTHLTCHMRTHTGEKPYKCSLCGKLFRQSYALTKHMRTHPADNPF